MECIYAGNLGFIAKPPWMLMIRVMVKQVKELHMSRVIWIL